jgi:hypothetical protein
LETPSWYLKPQRYWLAVVKLEGLMGASLEILISSLLSIILGSWRKALFQWAS